MATYSKEQLSGSTNGRGIKVVATATAGTTIHTATNTAGELDEVWLYAYNSHSGDVVLTIEFGGATDPDDHIVVTVPADDGLTLVVPGLPVNGGVVVRAFAATTNVVTIHGYVNNIAA